MEEKALDHFLIDYFNTSYQVPFDSFLYVNQEVTESLQKTVSTWIAKQVAEDAQQKKHSLLLDLFCGPFMNFLTIIPKSVNLKAFS